MRNINYKQNYVSGSLLSTLCVKFTDYSFQQCSEGRCKNSGCWDTSRLSDLFKMTLGKWQSRDSNPGILAPEPKPELPHFPRDEEPHVTCPRSSDYKWSVLFLIISDWSAVVKSLAFLPKVFLASISVMGILWATQGAHLESSGFASMHIEKGIARPPKKEASAALGDLFFQHGEQFYHIKSLQLLQSNHFFSLLDKTKTKQNKKSREKWWSD